MQIWQWLRHAVDLDDGRTITCDLVQAFVNDELDLLRVQVGEVALRAERFDIAARIAMSLMTGSFQEFMTDLTYRQLRAV